jgi:hypothetical protein
VGFICVFSQGAMMKRNNNSLTKDEILMFLSLFVVQLTCPKAYKRIAFEIVIHYAFKNEHIF